LTGTLFNTVLFKSLKMLSSDYNLPSNDDSCWYHEQDAIVDRCSSQNSNHVHQRRSLLQQSSSPTEKSQTSIAKQTLQYEKWQYEYT
jgi:hypothetical protein